MLFRGVICCSGGLYGCSGGLYAVQGGYMRKIMVKIVATTVVASLPPNGDRLQRRPLVLSSFGTDTHQTNLIKITL